MKNKNSSGNESSEEERERRRNEPAEIRTRELVFATNPHINKPSTFDLQPTLYQQQTEANLNFFVNPMLAT